jgi:ATP-grasp in the biosynthetic pathway with Ter operon
MRIWFNKTFSTISAVFNNLRQPNGADEAVIICSHTHASASAFLAADETYLEPAELAGQDYMTWCLDFCRLNRIDLFWPGKEAVLISNNHHLFQSGGTDVLSVASFATLSLLHNKANFYATLPTDVAKTMNFVAVKNKTEFDNAVAELSSKHEKICVKPAVSVYGLGFRILDTQRDSITLLLKGVEYQIPLQELRQGMNNTSEFNSLLVMEHLAGSEWSVDCAGKHGLLLCAVQRKKSLMAGHGQTIDNNPEIAAMVERLTAHFMLNGIFNIQFKEGSNGPRLLEINPRPSGGFGMACLSGANLAKIALKGVKNEKIDPPKINYGLKVTEINTPVIISSA